MKKINYILVFAFLTLNLELITLNCFSQVTQEWVARYPEIRGDAGGPLRQNNGYQFPVPERILNESISSACDGRMSFKYIFFSTSIELK